MQIVIDISEEQYVTLNAKSQDAVLTVVDHALLIKAIKDGTPLPKGHGDLIDKSLLDPDSDYDDGLYYAVSIGQINGAPVVIKADRDSEEV